MDRAYFSGASGSAPVAPASPSIGFPTAGNPATSTPATVPGPYLYHMIVEELRTVITEAGLIPDQANLTQLSQAIKLFSLPAGSVIHVAKNSAPVGYLKANGAAISRTAYAVLFAAIGTTFGVGDGSITFNIPDLRGEFLRGWDDARGIDTGRVFGSAQADLFKSHSHTAGWSVNTNVSVGALMWLMSGANQGQSSVETSATGNSENRPRNISLLACIKF
jgi:phage-related tail fiber protein